MTPERAGDGGAAPRLCPSGYALAASRPSAKRSLLPPGIGTWRGVPLCAGGWSSGAPQTQPGARLAGQPRRSASPQCYVRGHRGQIPSQRVTPGGRRERRAGEPAGSLLGSATYLGQREAPAGPRPGRAVGRGRGARAAGELPWWPAFGAAAHGARRTIPRGRRAGAGRRDPRDFLLRGVSSEPLAQRPRRRRASLGFHFF